MTGNILIGLRRKLVGKVKIIYLIGQLALGGSERQLYLLLKNINLEKFDVKIIVFNHSPNFVLNDALESIGIQIILVPERAKNILQRARFLFKVLMVERPDILHSWTVHDNAYAGVIGWLAGIPIRWGSVRGSIKHDSFRNLPWLLKWFSLFSVSKLIVNTQSIQKELMEWPKIKNRIEVFRNCIEVNNNSEPVDLSNFGILPNQVLIGIVGNIRKIKNHALFVDVMIKTLPDYPQTVAIIVGDKVLGHESLELELREKIQQANMTDRIILTGFRDDVPALMHRFSIFCLTSDSEGMPNVILEAMAAACPVIASRVDGIPEIVHDGVNGLLAEPGSVIDFESKVRFLLDNPLKAKAMGFAGQNIISNQEGCRTAIRKLTGFYLEALSQKDNRVPV